MACSEKLLDPLRGRGRGILTLLCFFTDTDFFIFDSLCQGSHINSKTQFHDFSMINNVISMTI